MLDIPGDSPLVRYLLIICLEDLDIKIVYLQYSCQVKGNFKDNTCQNYIDA